MGMSHGFTKLHLDSSTYFTTNGMQSDASELISL